MVGFDWWCWMCEKFGHCVIVFLVWPGGKGIVPRCPSSEIGFSALDWSCKLLSFSYLLSCILFHCFLYFNEFVFTCHYFWKWYRLIQGIGMVIACICTMKSGAKLMLVSHFFTGLSISHFNICICMVTIGFLFGQISYFVPWPCRLDLGAGKEIDLKECPRSKLRQQCIKYLGPVSTSLYRD